MSMLVLGYRDEGSSGSQEQQPASADALCRASTPGRGLPVQSEFNVSTRGVLDRLTSCSYRNTLLKAPTALPCLTASCWRSVGAHK